MGSVSCDKSALGLGIEAGALRPWNKGGGAVKRTH